MDEVGASMVGDEVYCLTRLSDISEDPANNVWRDNVSYFYDEYVRFYPYNSEVGTEAYIAALDAGYTEQSYLLFYIAHHALAAHYVNAIDKGIWRQAVMETLARVTDDDNLPVMSLGAAVFSLARTGPLDGTVIPPSSDGDTYWNNVTLAELPGRLLSHQVPTGEEYAGSFYWRFDHLYGSGYTEDTIYSLLGLVAVVHQNPQESYASAIQAARQILPIGVDDVDGKVAEHIWNSGVPYHAYAGEMLQALGAVSPAGDMSDDGAVTLIDLSQFVSHWLEAGCTFPDWCGGADLDHLGNVNLMDYAILSQHWQAGI